MDKHSYWSHTLCYGCDRRHICRFLLHPGRVGGLCARLQLARQQQQLRDRFRQQLLAYDAYERASRLTHTPLASHLSVRPASSAQVSLVGSDALRVTWHLSDTGLLLTTATAPPHALSYTFRLHLNGATADAIDAPTRAVRARIAA